MARSSKFHYCVIGIRQEGHLEVKMLRCFINKSGLEASELVLAVTLCTSMSYRSNRESGRKIELFRPVEYLGQWLNENHYRF